MPQDYSALKLLEKYRPGVDFYRNDVIGTTDKFLDGFCRVSECNFGNLFVDAMRMHHIKNFGGSRATIGLAQAGVIRSSIDVSRNGGNITREHVLNVLPFMNRIVVVRATGKAIVQALEHSVRR